MAYIVGLLTKAERDELERRGWELEPAPAELSLKGYPHDSSTQMRMVWVDADMFAIMDGPDWDKGENNAKDKK